MAAMVVLVNCLQVELVPVEMKGIDWLCDPVFGRFGNYQDMVWEVVDWPEMG